VREQHLFFASHLERVIIAELAWASSEQTLGIIDYLPAVEE